MGVLSAFLLWRIHYGIEVIPLHIRPLRNFPADLIDRADNEELSFWSERLDLARAKLP